MISLLVSLLLLASVESFQADGLFILQVQPI